MLKVLLSFASGGLLGDAFLHLIPHAILASQGDSDEHGHAHAHSHSHGGESVDSHAHDITVGLWVLVGIVTFLVVEKLIRIMKGGHHHSHGEARDKDSDQEDIPKGQKASKRSSKTKEDKDTAESKTKKKEQKSE